MSIDRNETSMSEPAVAPVIGLSPAHEVQSMCTGPFGTLSMEYRRDPDVAIPHTTITRARVAQGRTEARDAGPQVPTGEDRKLAKRLAPRQCDILIALYVNFRAHDSESRDRPRSDELAQGAWGRSADGRFKQDMAELSRHGLTANGHREGRGAGYYLTARGCEVARVLLDLGAA